MTELGNKCCFGQKVSVFKDKHPGGCRLLESAGNVSKEESELLFLTYHWTKDWNKIYSIADKYEYNELKNIKRSELHKEINNIFVLIEKRYWIHSIIFKGYCLFLTLLFLCLLINHCLLLDSINIYNSLFLALVWTTYPFSIYHTLHHSGNKLLFFGDNIFVDTFYEIFNNIVADSRSRWIEHHNEKHHLQTNSEKDADVIMSDPYMYLSSNYEFSSYRNFHQYQTIYFIFLAGFSQFRRIWITHWYHNQGKKIYIVIYYSIFIFIPYLLNNNSLLQNILNYIFLKYITSTLVLYLTAVSHNNISNKHLSKMNTNNFDLWMKQQIEESLSWNNDEDSIIDYIVTVITGGNNLQTEHHIAPALCPMYYLFASKHIRKLCQKHKITYNQLPNFFVAVYQFHTYLYDITRNTSQQ